jgi:hypothetical protein
VIDKTVTTKKDKGAEDKSFSNSFEVVKLNKERDLEEGEIHTSRMNIHTIQRIIEEALHEEHSRLTMLKDKGKSQSGGGGEH